MDIHDRPYEALTACASALDAATVRGRRRIPRVDASQGVPPAPRDPFGSFMPHLALKDWDRERGFVRPRSRLPLADLYACWDADALYLGLYAQDMSETIGYRDGRVPESDRATWTVAAGGRRGPVIRARIGSGGPAVVEGPAVRLVHLSGVELNTRCLAAMALPASMFGRGQLNSGDRLEVASNFLTHCGVYRTEWRGWLTLGGAERLARSESGSAIR